MGALGGGQSATQRELRRVAKRAQLEEVVVLLSYAVRISSEGERMVNTQLQILSEVVNPTIGTHKCLQTHTRVCAYLHGEIAKATHGLRHVQTRGGRRRTGRRGQRRPASVERARRQALQHGGAKQVVELQTRHVFLGHAARTLVACAGNGARNGLQ
jgi:hypothetical protein